MVLQAYARMMVPAPVYLLLLVALTGCSSHRPLKLSLRMQADIVYKTDREKLLHRLNKQITGREIDNLLICGETTGLPIIKSISCSIGHTPKADGPNEMVRDTVLNRHRLVMLVPSSQRSL